MENDEKNLIMSRAYMVEFTVKFMMENYYEPIEGETKEEAEDYLRDQVYSWIVNRPSDVDTIDYAE